LKKHRRNSGQETENDGKERMKSRSYWHEPGAKQRPLLILRYSRRFSSYQKQCAVLEETHVRLAKEK